MRFLPLLWAQLFRKKTRTVLTLLSVLVAFLLFGLLFALAYPKRLWLVIASIVVVAVGLEALQLLAATRHARIADVGVKLLGGGVGLALGAALTRLVARR